MRFSVAAAFVASAAVAAASQTYEEAPAGYGAIEPSYTSSAPVSPETTPAGYGEATPSTTVSATSYVTSIATITSCGPEVTDCTATESVPSSPETTVNSSSNTSVPSYPTEPTSSVTASSYETVPSVTSSAPVSPETTGQCPIPEPVTVTVTVGGAECGTSSGVPPYPTNEVPTEVPTGEVPTYPTGTAPGTAPGSSGTAAPSSPSAPSSPYVPFEGAGANVKASFGLGAVAAIAALFL